jgi:DNA polymerase III subunit epsilon
MDNERGAISMNSFLAIDFETANQSRDSACCVGLVRVEKSKIIHKAVHLIRPPSSDFMFTYIHGISWRDVASQPTFKEIWKEISPLFKGVEFLAAHNANFDASVLKACCQRYRIATPDLPFTCTVKLARSLWDVYPTKLPDVCRHLKIKLNHHEALSDALACAQIVMAAHKEAAKSKLTTAKTPEVKKVPAKGASAARSKSRTAAAL